MLGKRDKYFITEKNFKNEHVFTGWFMKEDLKNSNNGKHKDIRSGLQ